MRGSLLYVFFVVYFVSNTVSSIIFRVVAQIIAIFKFSTRFTVYSVRIYNICIVKINVLDTGKRVQIKKIGSTT